MLPIALHIIPKFRLNQISSMQGDSNAGPCKVFAIVPGVPLTDVIDHIKETNNRW